MLEPADENAKPPDRTVERIDREREPSTRRRRRGVLLLRVVLEKDRLAKVTIYESAIRFRHHVTNIF